MHEAMAATLDIAVEQIRKIQNDARVNGNLTRPRWPMIVLNSPKGWTGPKVVDGVPDRRHVPRASSAALRSSHASRTSQAAWKTGSRAIGRKNFSMAQGRLKPELAELAPKGDRRMGANPHANGGILLARLADARLPRLRGGCHRAGHSRHRRHACAGEISARRDQVESRRSEISASSARMKRSRTGWKPSLKQPSANGTPRPCRMTNFSRPPVASWKC